MNSDEVPLGEIRFDPSTRALTLKDGRSGQLRNKSKEVLSFLVRNPGRTVTKDELMENVWTDVAVTDDSLVQCIADIRRIVGRNAHQIVETIPREGYRLNLGLEESTARGSLMIPIGVAAVLLVALGLFWANRPSDVPAIPENTNIEAQSTAPGTDSTAAYLEVMQGRAAANLFSPDESLLAERHFRRAIDLDPNYARAHAELATIFAIRFENDWTVLQSADREKAFFYAERAVELEPESDLAHYALGRLHSIFSNYDDAESHLKRAMSLQPNNEDARAYYAIVRNFQGDAAGALEILEPTVASHPNPPFWYFLGVGNARFNLGHNELAETALIKCLELSSQSPYCMRYLMAVYGEAGRAADAADIAKGYAALGFTPSVSAIMDVMTFHHPEGRARLESALLLAGLPE